MKTAVHPCLPWTLTFYPANPNHSYRDQERNSYLSGTAFVKQFFPAFDAPAAAARVAARTGQSELALLAEWKAKGTDTADYGTRLHAYAESRILGTHPTPAGSPDEAKARTVVDAALTALEKEYEFLGAEQIVFDPLYRLAGTIDLPARNRETGAILIADWKTAKAITDDAYGQTCLAPIDYIPASKRARYGLQLSLYAWLMLDSGYLPEGTEIETAVIQVARGASYPEWIPLPYAGEVVREMVDAHWDKIASHVAINAALAGGNASGERIMRSTLPF